jgi:hypothetical protein
MDTTSLFPKIGAAQTKEHFLQLLGHSLPLSSRQCELPKLVHGEQWKKKKEQLVSFCYLDIHGPNTPQPN